ncbi:MAG: hypothetical protein JO291_09980, partial [Acidimicrobiia bacterium]|nr:hypothetical protein [Acidimicrobiia bacterium]
PLDLAGTTLVAAGATVALAAVCLLAGQRDDVRWSLAAATAAVGALTVAWSTATPGLSVVGAATIALAAGVLALAGTLHEDRHLAVVTSFAAIVAAAVTAGVGASALGATAAGNLVVATATGLALGLLGGLVLDPTGRQEWHRIDGLLALATEAAGWALHGAALCWIVESHDPRTAAALFGTGALAAGIHSVRPGRRPLAGVAAIEGLAFVWLQLASAGVATAEAYTLPLAAVLLGVGVCAQRWFQRSGEHLESWLIEGPALVVALAPTVVLACTDPGLVRPLGGLIAGALVLALGAVTGRKAPVDAGAAVVFVLGLRQLVPVMDDLPSWLIIGATGAFLLALGATFEQRRRQLHDTRARYAALR